MMGRKLGRARSLGRGSAVDRRAWKAVCLGLALSAFVSPAPRVRADPAAARDSLASLVADRPVSVPRGTLTSIEHLLEVADNIERGYPKQAAAWRARAKRYLGMVEQGIDPYPLEHGAIVNRAYRSPASQRLQGYAIYIPPDYDPSKKYPLYIALHGGSSNGNLFLGVVLGNNMPWERYIQHLYDDYTPRWTPDWIVVAPTGFGQVMWRFMGEEDVLDVLEDVARHYSVDEDRVVLGGLSNGGVGAYSIGTRHASRFAVVQAMAGAPSWFQYGGGNPTEAERIAIARYSGLHLAENTTNTDFRYYHGKTDGGPMRPRFVEEYTAHRKSLGLDSNVTWYDTGHDILYFVHRHGRVYDQLAKVVRDRRPREVQIVTGDYRANRQHWVTVTRIERYPELARVTAKVEANALSATTDNVLALSFDIRDVPLADKNAGDSPAETRIVIDGTEVYRGPRKPLGDIMHFTRDGGAWKAGFPDEPEGELWKRPGLSGPLTDPYRERMVHVYGTKNDATKDELERAARTGSDGWPKWLWGFDQEVVADTEVDQALMENAHLVLYGTDGDNAVLERMKSSLPFRVEGEALVSRAGRYEGKDVGVRFIYPNPLAPSRYVIVQTGVTTKAVRAGHNLPDFLPDYVVYDGRTTRSRQRLITGSNRALAMGYFDRRWRLKGKEAETETESASGTSAETESETESQAETESETAAATEAGRARTRIFPPAARTHGDPAPQDDETASTANAPNEPASATSAPEEAGSPEAGATSSPVNAALPVPLSPELPPVDRFAAPRSDPAGRIAREIMRRVRAFTNYRAKTAGATWVVDEEAMWQVKRQRACWAALERADVPARPVYAHPTPVPSPVELLGPVNGVWFKQMHDERPFIISCELALKLPRIVRVLKRHGIRGVEVMSAYRERPRPSFHTFGLALDMSRFWTASGWLSVRRDFIETRAVETCAAPKPKSRRARVLLSLACELAESRLLSSILTPNYNDGHRDHFHVDARPGDPRVFLR